MDNEWKLYKVNMKYIRNLKNVEQKATGRTNTILSVSTQTHKQGRPFLGILVLVNERKYCIPLSSVEEKEKYKSMAENITCRKIRDDDGNVTSNELYQSVMKKRGIEKDSWSIPVNIVRYNLD